MRARRTTGWYKKHIPTRWGIAVLSILVLATVILIPVLKQQQQSQSEASGAAKIKTTHTVCISYDVLGNCKLYQTTVTTVNTNSPCIARNPANQCVTYQDTNVGVSLSPIKPGTANTTSQKHRSKSSTSNPVVVSTTGPGILICRNGQAVAVGGAAHNESRSELAHICSLNPNSLFFDGGRYNCGSKNIPAQYKSYAAKVCAYLHE